MSIPKNISMTVGVADPNNPQNVIKPNADGSINVSTVQKSYQLAGIQGGAGVSLAAGASTTAVATSGGSWIWDYQFSGATTLVLQSLKSDGVTWAGFTPAATTTATGAQGVVLGNNPSNVANTRITNTGGATATALFSSLS